MGKNALIESAKAQDMETFRKLLKTEDINAYIAGYDTTREQTAALLPYGVIVHSDARIKPLGVLVLENQKDEKYTPFIQELLAQEKLDLDTPICKSDETMYPLRFMLAADTTKGFVNLKALLKRQDWDVNRDLPDILRSACSPLKAVAVMEHPKADVNQKNTYLFWGRDCQIFVGKAECPIWMAAGIETALKLCECNAAEPDAASLKEANQEGSIALKKFLDLSSKAPADGSLIGTRFGEGNSEGKAYFGFKHLLNAVVGSYAEKLGQKEIAPDVCKYILSVHQSARKFGIMERAAHRGHEVG